MRRRIFVGKFDRLVLETIVPFVDLFELFFPLFLIFFRLQVCCFYFCFNSLNIHELALLFGLVFALKSGLRLGSHTHTQKCR